MSLLHSFTSTWGTVPPNGKSKYYEGGPTESPASISLDWRQHCDREERSQINFRSAIRPTARGSRETVSADFMKMAKSSIGGSTLDLSHPKSPRNIQFTKTPWNNCPQGIERPKPWQQFPAGVFSSKSTTAQQLRAESDQQQSAMAIVDKSGRFTDESVHSEGGLSTFIRVSNPGSFSSEMLNSSFSKSLSSPGDRPPTRRNCSSKKRGTVTNGTYCHSQQRTKLRLEMQSRSTMVLKPQMFTSAWGASTPPSGQTTTSTTANTDTDADASDNQISPKNTAAFSGQTWANSRTQKL